MSKQIDPKKKRNALGRGLSALLSDSGGEENTSRNPSGLSQNSPTSGVNEIPIDQIETNPYQPRTQFDLVALEELSDSIKAQGIIQPITVRRLGGNRFQLISGERRLQATKMAGLQEIPAYVRTANDEQMLEMALIENIQRQDLNPMEIAMAYQRMVDELSLKHEELGEKVGKNRATVNNYLRLLKLPPEIQVGLRDGKISMGHARALITVERPEEQISLFRLIVTDDLSVRKVEELVRGLAESKTIGAKGKSSASTPPRNIYIADLENRLEEKFGNRVTLNQKGSGKGEIRIPFESTEDLNRILEIIDL